MSIYGYLEDEKWWTNHSFIHVLLLQRYAQMNIFIESLKVISSFS